MQGLLNIELICAVKCVATAAISQVQGVTDPVDFDRMGGMSNVAPTTKPRSTWQPQTTTSAVPNWFTKLIWYVHWPTTRKNHCFIPSLSHTQNSTVSIWNMLYILLAANPNTYPWTANTSKTCRFCMSPGIMCTAGIDIKTSSAIWTVWIIECAICLSGPMMSFAAFWKTTVHLSL